MDLIRSLRRTGRKLIALIRSVDSQVKWGHSTMPEDRILEIGGCRVDLDRGILLRDEGDDVEFRPLTLGVLSRLARTPGTIVGKHELIADVWGGIAVTDDSLVQCIGELRRAFRDTEQKVIRTFPKRGYMLCISDTVPANDITRRAAPSKTGLALAAAGALAAMLAILLVPQENHEAEPARIAVLPFEAITGGDRWTRFADGLTEDIITDLARFRDIPVIARSSTEKFRAAAFDVREIGEQLDVAYVLFGRLRVDGNSLRVTVQLAESATGDLVWSERYDRGVGDLFTVQDDITRKIANTLIGWQSPVSRHRTAKAEIKNSRDLDAYDLWLLGSVEKHKMTPAGIAKARELYERAQELDPDFGPLLRDLGFTYGIAAAMGITESPGAAIQKFGSLMDAAIRLDPEDPFAWFGKAMTATSTEAARAFHQHALELGPNNANVLIVLAGSAALTGVSADGPVLAARALRLNPSYPHWWNESLTYAYVYAGDFEAARQTTHELGVASPNFAAHRAMTAAMLGLEEFRTATSIVLKLDPEWSVEAAFRLPAETDQARTMDAAIAAGLPVCMTQAQIAKRPPAARYLACMAERGRVASAATE